MALVNCPECSHDVSDLAPACPNCGCPTAPQQPKSRFFVLGALILVVLGGAFYLLSGHQSATTVKTGNQTISTPAKKEITDADRILGKWKGLDTIEFFSNGDHRAYTWAATYNGKWKMLDGKRLNLIMDSSLLPDTEWRYDLTGDKLTLTGLRGDVKLEYTRAK